MLDSTLFALGSVEFSLSNIWILPIVIAIPPLFIYYWILRIDSCGFRCQICGAVLSAKRLEKKPFKKRQCRCNKCGSIYNSN